MIERLAQAARRPVSRETVERLESYVAMLKDENRRQNLVSASTIESIWERHILDSAQMLRFESSDGASWADIGSGAGLPGIVIACLADGPVTLIEPRRLRAAFLGEVIDKLGLRATVQPVKAERATGSYDMICARAVAPLWKLLKISHHLSTGKTTWALPKGKSAQTELAEAKRRWHGVFHVEQSFTDPCSFMVVARNVEARG
ncbi:MAG: 16S rRNA (guanine(527)-N(7))-methyltransferase RsmG [Sphingomicrobium sp.]